MSVTAIILLACLMIIPSAAKGHNKEWIYVYGNLHQDSDRIDRGSYHLKRRHLSEIQLVGPAPVRKRNPGAAGSRDQGSGQDLQTGCGDQGPGGRQEN